MHRVTSGWIPLHKFGHNPDVDTGAAEDVWDGGGLYTWPTSAAATTIVSASTDDDAEGTGAQTVFVQGLDANGALLSETATMDGTSAVTLSGEYLRVFRAYVVSAGTGETNAGNIQVKHGATVLAQITAGYGQTLMAIYTVPTDYPVAGLAQWYVTLGRAITSVGEVAMLQRSNGGAWRTVELISMSNTSSSFQYNYPVWLDLKPLTDICIRVLSVTANNTTVSAGFDINYRG